MELKVFNDVHVNELVCSLALRREAASRAERGEEPDEAARRPPLPSGARSAICGASIVPSGGALAGGFVGGVPTVLLGCAPLTGGGAGRTPGLQDAFPHTEVGSLRGSVPQRQAEQEVKRPVSVPGFERETANISRRAGRPERLPAATEALRSGDGTGA